MRFVVYLALWLLLGMWSFILTQYLIKGWDYVRSQPEPFKLFISAMALGPITTLTCFYTLYKYYKGGKNERKN